MKRILFFTIVVFLLAFNIIPPQGKIKEGKITFEISYPDSAMTQDMISIMPKELLVYFKNGDTRTEMSMGKAMLTMIKYGKSGDLYNLKNIKTNKIAVKMSKDYLDKLKDSLLENKPVIKMTDETKTIASFICRKEILNVAVKGAKKSIEVWVTKDIDNVDISEYNMPDIEGFPMEFTNTSRGVTMHMLCKSIEQIAIADSLFKIPDDYKIIPIESISKKGAGSRR